MNARSPGTLAVGCVEAGPLTRLLISEEPIEIGQTFKLPQALTGFACDKADTEMRWAIVVAANERKQISAWVLPRTASGSGVAVPASAATGFTKDGWVFYKPRQIEFSILRTYQYGGRLEPSYLAAVVAFYRENRAREEEARRARQDARHQHRRHPHGRGRPKP
jgi:hypothetical protein